MTNEPLDDLEEPLSDLERNALAKAFKEVEEEAGSQLTRGQSVILLLVALDDKDVYNVIKEQLTQAIESLCEQGSVPVTLLIQAPRQPLVVTDIRQEI